MKVLKLREHMLGTLPTLAYVAFAPMAAKASDTAEVIPASVIGTDQRTGAAERVEVADLMVTLSQETASAACHLHNGIAAEESRKLLLETQQEFALYLQGLLYGSEELNIIGKEENRRTLARLVAVSDAWTPISEAIEAVLKDPNDLDAIGLIKAQNIPLHDAAALLLSEVVGVYSNPSELLQADALLIQFSGRQATLTQKLAKEACKIWTGDRSEALMEDFTKTIALYEATLNALHDGMPAVGIKAAPTDEIRAALGHEVARWGVIKGSLLAVKDSTSLSDELKAEVFHSLNEAMTASKGIADLYVKHAYHEY